MTDLKQYYADRISLELAGFSISKGAGASGYAEGVFVTVDYDAPSFIYKIGTDGTVTRSKTNNKVVKITIRTMNSNGDTNGFLSELLVTDENEPNGAGVGTFALKDLQGTTILFCNQSWITGFPKQPFDQSANEREWEIIGIRDEIVVGGN